MKADLVEMSWDENKKKWLVRIGAGEEVIRRFCDLPANADENDLRSAAIKTATDDGYETTESSITVHR